jgi:hypothetical protein
VTVLIDDTPNAVVLSAFDPVRREIARESMNRLLLDGRIHPTRIEEVVEKVTREIDEAILQHGEIAVRDAGVGPMHPEVIKLLGRLHYRHSFSQNVLAHSVEVAHLTGLMAAELGVDAAAARRAVSCMTLAKLLLRKWKARMRWWAPISSAALAKPRRSSTPSPRTTTRPRTMARWAFWSARPTPSALRGRAPVPRP